ncbi:TrbI/VirB10 family protein [Tardiphaga sp. 538_B7_N1_4]|uniref:TrbI/VirB10 family protein n=1 Tax=unclassified Tardiphaga TaxID=2631404 RepID=UPI001B8A01EB|nr:TrbI/VirB10 family protein [Bradyrhizobium diazoefficiens]MBR0962530.1 TrbI/VirB10 family protein [Bradyrhizobium diazoefficiens]MBR0980694.1 TrbI/VirB10 family protein [Bradyrhizobium diazoefficiens]MBR1010240.1 TrbI/VirB10 family protein [Bradyrhizobium diazoefficiens]MBR1016828.1 TrbI/VirB10 family protein [Bradyrhizobium diazoefficiens]MBR1053986.1 TrbI/VirB10 family protein [Bradyrhizobium diazoefficiens]
MVSEPRIPSEDRLAEEFRLRAERPRVTRLSRKVLAGLGGVVGIAVLGAMIWALQSRGPRQSGGTELYSTDHKTTADELAKLPKDYAGLPRDTAPPPRTVPQLGPPLPGDLGRPILAAQGASTVSLDAGEQRIVQENEAARVSRVFASTNVRQSPSSATPSASASSNAQTPDTKPPPDPDSLQNMQDRKLAFVSAPADKRTVSPDRIEKPASRYVVQAGAVIPAALITGIRSDLPGEISAQVTENVFDSPTGKFLLVPQGARLIGQYDSQISFGQSRVLLVWNRIIMPNGKSIVLERQSGADTQGYAGLEDGVDYHWGNLLGAAAISTLLGIGSELVLSGDNSLVRSLRTGSQDTINQSGQTLVRRQLNVQSILTIRPGFPVRVIVNRDLVLAPYKT